MEYVKIDDLKKFPLEITEKEYNGMSLLLLSDDEITKVDRERLLKVIENAKFWKNKYVHLAEEIQILIANEQLNMTFNK